jgi:hypothetical protein
MYDAIMNGDRGCERAGGRRRRILFTQFVRPKGCVLSAETTDNTGRGRRVWKVNKRASRSENGRHGMRNGSREGIDRRKERGNGTKKVEKGGRRSPRKERQFSMDRPFILLACFTDTGRDE